MLKLRSLFLLVVLAAPALFGCAQGGQGTYVAAPNETLITTPGSYMEQNTGPAINSAQDYDVTR